MAAPAPWRQRLLDGLELTAEEKGRAIVLITRLPEADWETLVDKDPAVAKAAVRELLSPAGPRAPKDWSGTWLYSKYLAEELDLKAPYQQYGLYASTAYGVLHLVSKWRRANLLGKAVLHPDPGEKEWLRLLSGATEDQFKLATRYVSRFKAQGVIVAVGAPLLWLGYCRACELYKQQDAGWPARV